MGTRASDRLAHDRDAMAPPDGPRPNAPPPDGDDREPPWEVPDDDTGADK